jgi:hypothetical protein
MLQIQVSMVVVQKNVTATISFLSHQLDYVWLAMTRVKSVQQLELVDVLNATPERISQLHLELVPALMASFLMFLVVSVMLVILPVQPAQVQQQPIA